MSRRESETENLTSYIRELEAAEKAKKKRLVILAGTALIVAGLLFTTTWYLIALSNSDSDSVETGEYFVEDANNYLQPEAEQFDDEFTNEDNWESESYNNEFIDSSSGNDEFDWTEEELDEYNSTTNDNSEFSSEPQNPDRGNVSRRNEIKPDASLLGPVNPSDRSGGNSQIASAKSDSRNFSSRTIAQEKRKPSGKVTTSRESQIVIKPNANLIVPENSINTRVYEVADRMPQFPGGAGALYRFVRASLRYPPKAITHNIEGQVHVRFIVAPDGRLSNFNVVKKLGHDCDEEAIRVVKQMPRWVPGEIQGQRVAVWRTVQVTFVLPR